MEVVKRVDAETKHDSVANFRRVFGQALEGVFEHRQDDFFIWVLQDGQILVFFEVIF